MKEEIIAYINNENWRLRNIIVQTSKDIITISKNYKRFVIYLKDEIEIGIFVNDVKIIKPKNMEEFKNSLDSFIQTESLYFRR